MKDNTKTSRFMAALLYVWAHPTFPGLVIAYYVDVDAWNIQVQ